MNRVSKIACEIVSNSLNGINNVNYDDLNNGIEKYIEDYGYDKKLNSFDDDFVRDILQTFIGIEIEDMKKEYIPVYFSNYEAISSFKALSAQVFNMAICKYQGSNVDMNLAKKLEDSYVAFMNKNSLNSGLKQFMLSEISDVDIDLNYVLGIDNKISFRIRQYYDIGK